MRKRTAILVVSVLVAALLQAGCGGQQGEDTTDPTISSEETATP